MNSYLFYYDSPSGDCNQETVIAGPSAPKKMDLSIPIKSAKVGGKRCAEPEQPYLDVSAQCAAP